MAAEREGTVPSPQETTVASRVETSKLPKSREIALGILLSIKTGEFLPGERIPKHDELIVMYSGSKKTVEVAGKILKTVIEFKAGSGTHVREGLRAEQLDELERKIITNDLLIEERRGKEQKDPRPNQVARDMLAKIN